MSKTISFLGAGKMAEALISGILFAGNAKADDITASDISKNRLEYLKRKFNIKTTTDNIEAVNNSEIIFISVKPQQSNGLLCEIEQFCENKLFISIMAGINLKSLENSLGNVRVVRVMPNTPALVGKGISAVAKGSRAKTADLETAKLLLLSVGQVIIVEENLMDAITALSGSGPAYFYWLTEVLSEVGENMGLTKDEAKDLANATFVGAADLLEKTEEDAQTLRKNVTSPGGTTEAALNFLKDKKAKEIIMNAVKAAKEKSKELSNL